MTEILDTFRTLCKTHGTEETVTKRPKGLRRGTRLPAQHRRLPRTKVQHESSRPTLWSHGAVIHSGPMHSQVMSSKGLGIR